MTYNHVLVAIDSTDEADQVLEVATFIASQSEAKLSLISVVEPVNQVYSGFDITAVVAPGLDLQAEAYNQRQQTLAEKADELSVDGENVHVLIGQPARSIRDTAAELGADLIVIGSHGRHGLGLLLGSTANGVLHGTPCDVYVVRIHNEG